MPAPVADTTSLRERDEARAERDALAAEAERLRVHSAALDHISTDLGQALAEVERLRAEVKHLTGLHDERDQREREHARTLEEQKRAVVNAERQIAVIKRHFHKRCENLTAARDLLRDQLAVSQASDRDNATDLARALDDIERLTGEALMTPRASDALLHAMVEAAQQPGPGEDGYDAARRVFREWPHAVLSPGGRMASCGVHTEDEAQRSVRHELCEPAEVKCGFCKACHPVVGLHQPMYLCPKCGNKRCPGAADHRRECSGSNAPGQPGSLYERASQPAEPPVEG